MQVENESVDLMEISWLVAAMELLLEDREFEKLDRLFEVHPELLDEIGKHPIDVEFADGKIMFEKLKDRLQQDGIWVSEGENC